MRVTDYAWWCKTCNVIGAGNQPWLDGYRGNNILGVDDGIPICCQCGGRLILLKAVQGSASKCGSRSFGYASASEWREVIGKHERG